MSGFQSSEATQCYLCTQPAEIVPRQNDVWDVKCDRCGRYRITDEARLELRRATSAEQVALSGIAREQWERRDPVEITTDKIPALLSVAPRRVPDRSMRLLAALVRRSPFFGSFVVLNVSKDFPLGFAQNHSELEELLRYLSELSLISSPSRDSDGLHTKVTAAGFEALETHRASNADSDKAFVAMSFNPEMAAVYTEAIGPAIRDCGYRPVRIDLEEFNDDVVDRVLAEIREARFVVADFTHHRNGVYFEAGFAMGLGLPVVWLCHVDHMGKAHFDTNHFNHIAWDSHETLRGRLSDRIRATVGRGPLGA